MKKTLTVIAFVIATLTFTSCQKEELNVISNTSEAENLLSDKIDNCVPTEVSLIAGQTINAGTVTVTNDDSYIYVTYTAENGYLLTKTHVYAGDCELVPVNSQGNPVPGLFPYQTAHNNLTNYTYAIPVSAIGNCGCIAAHAALVKLNASGQVIEQQTGWGNGIRINPNSGNWGMKFSYCICTPQI